MGKLKKVYTMMHSQKKELCIKLVTCKKCIVIFACYVCPSSPEKLMLAQLNNSVFITSVNYTRLRNSM